MISRSTFLLSICFNAPTNASSEPCASHFSTIRRTFFPPAASSRLSRVARFGIVNLSDLLATTRSSLNVFSERWESITNSSSPALRSPANRSTFRAKATVQQLFFSSNDICRRKIDLIGRNHYLYARRGFGVNNGFNGLRHEAIVGCDNEHNDIGDIRPPRAHRRKGSVPRRVDKGKCRAIVINAIGADMLSNAAGFARRDTGFANGVHQRCLAMINMSHERDNRCPQLEFFFLFNDRRRGCGDDLCNLVDTAAFFSALLFQNKAMAFRYLRSDVRLDCLVNVGENVVIHQLRNELMRVQA